MPDRNKLRAELCFLTRNLRKTNMSSEDRSLTET